MNKAYLPKQSSGKGADIGRTRKDVAALPPYPGPSAPCVNPGFKTRRVSQLLWRNESPDNAHPSLSQAQNSRRGWVLSLFLPLQSTAGPHTWVANLSHLCTCGRSMACSSAALGVSRQGVQVVLSFWESKSVQVTSFSCMLQGACLGWLNGSVVSVNFLYFDSLSHNLCAVWVCRRDCCCLPEPFVSISSLFLLVIYKSKAV